MTKNDAKRVRLITSEAGCLSSENAASDDSAKGRYRALLRALHTCWKKRGDRQVAPLFLTLLKIVRYWAEDDEAHTCTIRKHRDHITGKITTSRTH